MNVGKPVTAMGHLWFEYKQPGYIKTREYACLTCGECSKLHFASCLLGTSRVNIVQKCESRYENSGQQTQDRETANRGKARALQCEAGQLIGGECANKTEPYIVCSVVKPYAVWEGAPGRSWMGQIKEGDEYVTCRKWQRQSDTRYLQCQGARAEFYLLAEDVRIIFRKHEVVQPVSRPRREVNPLTVPPTCQLDSDELAVLQNRVFICHRDSGDAV